VEAISEQGPCGGFLSLQNQEQGLGDDERLTRSILLFAPSSTAWVIFMSSAAAIRASSCVDLSNFRSACSTSLFRISLLT
jgi:hypothetical protein